MNLFKQLESVRRFGPRRILLYGVHGIGTSSFAAGLPSPVFVPADESVSHIECPRFPIARCFADLMQALQELYVEPHDYRTVILDPLKAVERLIQDEVCHQHNVKHLTDLAHATRHMLVCWQRLLRRLDLLHNDIDLHVVLIGHAIERLVRCPCAGRGATAQQNSATRCFSLALARRVSALLQGWCDEVLFATHAEPGPSAGAVSVDSPAAGIAPVSAALGDARVIYTMPSPRHAAKNHLDLPAQLPFDPAALLHYLRRDGASAKPQSPNLN